MAHDNRRIIPGYKTYLRRDDGTRPDVYVAFFDLDVSDGMWVAGLALPVDDARRDALDAREANYERVDVTGLVTGCPAPSGPTSAAASAGPARARPGRGQRGGVEGLPGEGRGGLPRRGKAAFREFERTTVTHGIQALDLDRRDVPEASREHRDRLARRGVRRLRRRPAAVARAGGRTRRAGAGRGAGTGRVALDLAARGHDMVAVDSDPDLVAACAERAADRSLSVTAVVPTT